MARGAAPRHAGLRGWAASGASYREALAELSALRSARWDDQLELVRLTALTDGLTAQVAALRGELTETTRLLRSLQAQPPRVVEVPVAPPAPERGLRDDLLLAELSELRRLVAHQQQLLGDLTVRLLDLLARFLPSPGPTVTLPNSPPVATPSDPLLDDETATRLRVIREAFGR